MENGLPEGLIANYIAYIENMYANGFPPIFEFRHLARLLGRSKRYLSTVVRRPEKHYRQFQIPKASGDVRTINAPYPALLECQKWILANILSKIKLPFVAHGFCKKKSILTNAQYHLKAPNILKMDLEKFFPNIKLSEVISVFRKCGYPNNVSYYLAKICTYENCLPQGAATSPYLSNIIASKMDWRFYHLCKKSKNLYTRYADDLTFSGKYIHDSFVSIAEKIIIEEGFKVNDNKTHLLRRKGRRIVTGISVNNSVPKIPREMKRDLRQQVYYTLKYGIKSHMINRNIRDPFYIYSLYGKLTFWKWVEPENSFLERNLLQIKQSLPHG